MLQCFGLFRRWSRLQGFMVCWVCWEAGTGIADDRTGVAAGRSQPNMVVFFTDDLGWRDTEPYGSTEARTPHLMKFAAEGVRFTHAFVASPSCGPSRTALLTGLMPARNGAEPNHTPKRQDVASLPPILVKAGYDVAAFGKVAHGKHAALHGFTTIDPDPSPEHVAKYLAQRDRTKPVCLMLGTRHPHVPWSDNVGYRAEEVLLPPTHVDTPETREQRTKYLTDVTNADTWLGESLEQVRRYVTGDTLFLFTSDHGAQWPFSKWNLYDAGIRVPLIAVWPGKISAGSTQDAMVQWIDLLPTLIEIAGEKVPEGLDGRSFAGLWSGTTRSHRDRIFTTHSGDGKLMNVYPIRSVRTRDWKYIRNLHPEFQHHSHISRAAGKDGLIYWKSWEESAKSNPLHAAKVRRHIERPREELYDLQADPFEQNNLAALPEHQKRRNELADELDLWMRQQGDEQKVFGTPTLLGEPAPPIP